jgi:hypothetical protein
MPRTSIAALSTCLGPSFCTTLGTRERGSRKQRRPQLVGQHGCCTVKTSLALECPVPRLTGQEEATLR